MQTLEAKCAWLKHDWERAVDEAADFTGCACKTREGIVSPTCESLRGEAIFTWIPSWGMQCRTVGRSHCKQLQVAHTPPPFFLILPPSSLYSEGSEQSNRIGQSWHHRFCYVVRKLSVWCNWCSLLEIPEANRKSVNNTFTKVWVFVILLQTTFKQYCREMNLWKSNLDITPLLLLHDSTTSSSNVVLNIMNAIKTPILNSWKTYFETCNALLSYSRGSSTLFFCDWYKKCSHMAESSVHSCTGVLCCGFLLFMLWFGGERWHLVVEHCNSSLSPPGWTNWVGQAGADNCRHSTEGEGIQRSDQQQPVHEHGEFWWFATNPCVFNVKVFFFQCNIFASLNRTRMVPTPAS